MFLIIVDQFLNTKISEGSAATRVRCGRILQSYGCVNW